MSCYVTEVYYILERLMGNDSVSLPWNIIYLSCCLKMCVASKELPDGNISRLRDATIHIAVPIIIVAINET